MTWDPNQPNAAESPNLFPTKCNDNWARLEAIIDADHNFTDSTASNEGYHQIIHWIKESSDPSYISGTAQTYVKDVEDLTLNTVAVTSQHMFHRSSDGTTQREDPITPVPVRAYVNFNGIGTPAIRSSYNVDAVTRFSGNTGEYLIEFVAGALPTNAFAVVITGMRNTNSSVSGYVRGNASYNTAMQTASIIVKFENLSSEDRDVLMGSVIIYGG